VLRRGEAVASADARGVAGLDVDAVAKLLRGRRGSVVAVVVRRGRALHAATI
jgi:hypothetical protein